MHQFKEVIMTNGEALEHLMEVRESTYEVLRLMYKRRSELTEDIRKARKLIDDIEAEIRRIIEI